MKKSEEEQFKRERGQLWTDAVAFALECLWSWCPEGEKPRLHDTAKAYAKRVFEELGKPPEENREAYVEQFAARLEELITDNEMKIRQLSDEAWEHALLAAIATASRKFGAAQILDRDVQDWIQDAALQLVNRSRHFPADREEKPVTLATWLFHTARSNIHHARRDAKKHPQEPLDGRENRRRPRGGDAGDAQDDPPDEQDDDDADHDRRRPAHPAFHATGVRSNARLHPSSAR